MALFTYKRSDGSTINIEYDPDAPCNICGEPIRRLSTAGPNICPWCDIGQCRYCGVNMTMISSTRGGGRSLQQWPQHMKYHKLPEPQTDPLR